MRRIFVIAVCIAATAFGAFLLVPDKWLYARRAAPLIASINAYRARSGRLPDPADEALMASLGFTINVGYRPEFVAIDSTHFRLVYVEGFDCPYMTYDSPSNSWSRTCN